ncbi:MAG: hypothetical protein IJA97_00595 [Clostridia bacterium]|nr:hypothetical protein [Clostridia bacterium]
MRNKIIKRILIGFLALVLTAGVYFLGFFTYKWSLSDTEQELLKILDAYDKHYYYQDPNIIDTICDAILDDYSDYYTPEEYEAVIRTNLGKNVGIGLSFLDDTNVISEVIINSPCFKAGIKAGGTVISAVSRNMGSTGENIRNFILDLSEGSNVTLDIDYSGTVKRYEVKKQTYNQSYVTYKNAEGTFAYVDNSTSMELKKISDDNLSKSGVGYIKYTSFNGKDGGLYGSVSQMKTALEKFKLDGNHTLIFDLRDNGGGYMDVLSGVAGMLVEKHEDRQVMSITKDHDGKETKHYVGTNYYSSYAFEKIYVLANQNTASASEVLIGAMLDYDTKGVVSIVLDGHEKNEETIYKTYGKGIMQTTYKYLDGSAVKLTTAKVFWPVSNRCIHGVGVTTSTSQKVLNAENENAFEYALSIIE